MPKDGFATEAAQALLEIAVKVVSALHPLPPTFCDATDGGDGMNFALRQVTSRERERPYRRALAGRKERRSAWLMFAAALT